jgi:hypothetical protein
MSAVMRLLGRVVGLQVQRASLKVGDGADRRYDPSAIVPVPRLRVDADGALGVVDDGEPMVDVHNRRHPASKNRGTNPLSVGFTSHYALMRQRFGAHLVDGIAGENMLVKCDEAFTAGILGERLLIRGQSGEIRLIEMIVAEPCAPFSRFALGAAVRDADDPAIGEALRFLRLGMRGYYGVASRAGEIARGDEVYLL